MPRSSRVIGPAARSGAVLGLIAAAAAAPAGAQTEPPCSPAAAQPTLTVSDPKGGGALFATHMLRVRAKAPDGGPEFVRSLAAPGARPGNGEGILFSDSAGQLTVTAVVSSWSRRVTAATPP